MHASRFLPLLAVFASITASGASAQHVARPTQDKIHPHMHRLLDERGPSKAWVFFKDKGIESADQLRDALAFAEQTLDPRTRARRAARRTKPGLVDYDDLPVNPAYVDRAIRTGAQLVVSTTWLNAISVFASRSQLQAIAELSFVDRIEPVRRGQLVDGIDVGATAGPAQPSAQRRPKPPSWYGSSQVQLEQINLIAVHRMGYTGKNVVIGVLDTGFHRGHEAFNQPGHVVDVVAEYDFVDDDSNTGIESGDDPSQHNHGTWILGTMAAYLPTELVGGAYDASFILCKTEDVTNEYQQEEDFYVAGLQFIESNGGDMSTSSLGYIDWYTQSNLDGLTAVTTLGVNAATANGMICLTAAGNGYHDTDPSTSALIAPADAFQVITMGAVESTGVIASFSSDGPTADGRVKPEILAMGSSTWTVCSSTDTDCLTTVSGTSLSTPVMAGAVACLIQAHPNWEAAAMRKRLFQTGDYFVANGTFDPEYVLGYGIPDVLKAGFKDPKHLPTQVPPTKVEWP